jgi:hypothetical protein
MADRLDSKKLADAFKGLSDILPRDEDGKKRRAGPIGPGDPIELLQESISEQAARAVRA